MENRPDLFLELPMQQPKLELANYVGAEGLPVPDRYDSVDQAVDSAETVLIRSEHPEDYDGLSGLIDTWKLTEDDKEELKRERAMDEMSSAECDIQRLGFLSWVRQVQEQGFTPDLERDLAEMSVKHRVASSTPLVDMEAVVRETTFTAWEFIPGENLTIVADTSVGGRYHIFNNGSSSRYCTWNVGQEGPFNELVDAYENVRNLEMFNPSHAYLMEFQRSNNGTFYFLQAHRTQDTSQPKFRLDPRAIPMNSIQATWVRGHTPPEGVTVDLCLYNFDRRGSREKKALDTVNDEAAVDTQGASELYEELRMRRRKIQIFTADTEADIVGRSSHGGPSKIAKPEVALATARDVAWHDIFRNFLGEEAFAKVEEGEVLQLPIHVVSDGARAYVEFA